MNSSQRLTRLGFFDAPSPPPQSAGHADSSLRLVHRRSGDGVRGPRALLGWAGPDRAQPPHHGGEKAPVHSPPIFGARGGLWGDVADADSSGSHDFAGFSVVAAYTGGVSTPGFSCPFIVIDW